MKRVNLLLGNSDYRINSIIEASVRDVCFNLAVVECFRTSRIDQFLRLGCHPAFDLIFVAPEHLVPEPSRKSKSLSIDEVLGVLRNIRKQRLVPIIGVAVPADLQAAIIEAGAENAFGPFFDTELLKAEVRRVLRLPHQALVEQEVDKPARWSLANVLKRGFQLGAKTKA